MYLKPSNPWNPGYALPKSVMAEPFGRGVYTSKDLARKSISQLTPEEFVGLGSLGLGSLGGSTIEGSSIHGSSIHGSTLAGSSIGGGAPSSGDPIAKFGRDGAALVMRKVMSVPQPERKAMLKAVLNAVDPGMCGDVEAKAAVLQKTKGYSAKQALEKAISASFANRFLKQLVELGRTKTPPSSGPLGLACDCGQKAMSGFWDDVYKYSGAKYVVGGSEAAARAGAAAVKGLGHLVCKAATSGGLPAVAGSVGGPLGASGAMVAGGLCPKGQVAVMDPGPQGGGGSSLMPVLLVGGAAVAAVLLLRK